MENLVIIQNEKAITTSLKVAEVFSKEHKNVVRDIENLMNDLQQISIKDALNFEPISYQDRYGREQRAYQMNRDGFTLLAMGYTGAKALKFKLDYINPTFRTPLFFLSFFVSFLLKLYKISQNMGFDEI
ncbi:MAG: Rha family transcriptional regulator [Microscillaceae bacterium]|nr:Rha family transcriptional regulator [Microscillaceae bacterium]